MPLANKGSKSEINKQSNSEKMYKPNNPIDMSARKALSKGKVARGGTIKLSGDIVSLASRKTINKAAETAKRRAR